MAYSHVAHDCIIKNHVILGNAAQLAGEVEIEDYANVSGGTLIHQFTRIGAHAMIQGGSKIPKDIPPYVMVGREPISYVGLNVVGLRRRGFTSERINSIQEIYRYLYQSGYNTTQAMERIETNFRFPSTAIIFSILFVIRRGIVRGTWKYKNMSRTVFPAEMVSAKRCATDVAPCRNRLVRHARRGNRMLCCHRKEILKREKLLVVCPNEDDVIRHFNKEEQKNLLLAVVRSNDTWARDHGALSVFLDGKPVILDFGFNAWGLKFAANYDNQITRELYEQDIFQPQVHYRCHLNFILEGGAIESDGKGTLLATSECHTSPNRNQPMELDDIEHYLKTTLGAKRVLWLNHGYLEGDDTDHHIDTLARFCNEHTIAYVQCNDPNDEHFDELKAMEKELRSFVTEEGKPYKLIPLPMADAIYSKGYRLPATYANFLVINEAVLMPFYGTPKDKTAKQQLQKAFPDRTIVGIDCQALIQQHGSLHCTAMQYPQGFL